MSNLPSKSHHPNPRFDKFYSDIATIIRAGQKNLIHTYAILGKRIAEEDEYEPVGTEQAPNSLLKDLAQKLNKEFGSGFSFPQLRIFRKFYLNYKNRINFEPHKQAAEPPLHPSLTWTHYRIIMQLPNEDQKIFYEQETIKQNWSTSQLQRQILVKRYERFISAGNENSKIKCS